MNQLALKHSSLHDDLSCTQLLNMAQRELAALFKAVTELFGSEQAELSAEDWLHEVEASDTLPASAREWRLVTVRATAELVRRLATPSSRVLPATAQVQLASS